MLRSTVKAIYLLHYQAKQHKRGRGKYLQKHGVSDAEYEADSGLSPSYVSAHS